MTKKVHFTRVSWGCFVALVAVSAIALGHSAAAAAGPVQQAFFEPDYEASGFVVPAGMPSPDAYFQSVEQAGFFGQRPLASALGGGQVGYGEPCDCGGGGCGQCGYGHGGYEDGGCGPGGCGHGGCGCGLLGGCGMFGGCGILGGCGHGGCLSRLRGMCLFCGGAGCGVCQSIGQGYLLGALRSLLPYGEAGLSTQRWYDLSADLMFLEVSSGTSGQVLTTQGKAGTPVLRADDADDDYSVGGRLSGAFIFGPGGNLEVTYLGGNRWSGDAVATGNLDLFSFLSEFGTAPDNGFADTDRSNVQRVASESTFHSGEVNYRRRTVGPYGRFQWSGLGGIRYLRFDSDFEYNTIGTAGGFLDYESSVQNEMVGVQTGGDLWWNLMPGINLGIGVKGGPMGNRIQRRAVANSPSFFRAPQQAVPPTPDDPGPPFVPGSPGVPFHPGNPAERNFSDYISKTAWMGELEATLLYRVSHSWTLKGQYYLLNVNQVGYGLDSAASVGESLNRIGLDNDNPFSLDAIQTRVLTISGFAIGAEYIW